MYQIFLHSCTDEQWGCDHVLAIENWGAYIFLDYGFLQVYAQEWDCCVR